MRTYRFFELNVSGVVDTAWETRFRDDQAALDHAAHRSTGRALEVWQGSRRVALFPPAPAGRLGLDINSHKSIRAAAMKNPVNP